MITDRNLYARFLRGESIQEIADALRIPTFSVEARLQDRTRWLQEQPRTHLAHRVRGFGECGEETERVTRNEDRVTCRKCLRLMGEPTKGDEAHG